MNPKPMTQALCEKCKHKLVCFFRRKVEGGEKHIINQIQSEFSERMGSVIPTIKIGVIDCMSYGPAEVKSVAVGEFAKKEENTEPDPLPEETDGKA